MHDFQKRFGALFALTYVSTAFVGANSFVAQAAPAQKELPLERYTCYQLYAPSLTYTYMGYFVLQPGKKYMWGFGKAKPTGRGRYTYGTKGILFVDGPLKGIKGTFETMKDGRHNIELKIQGKKQYARDDGIITLQANCDEHDPDDAKS